MQPLADQSTGEVTGGIRGVFDASESKGNPEGDSGVPNAEAAPTMRRQGTAPREEQSGPSP